MASKSSSPSLSAERIPTYEESIRTQPARPSAAGASGTFSPAPSGPPSLASRLAQARASRIQSLIDAHIEPLLEAQAAAGLHRTTAVLVPSNVSALQAASGLDSKQDFSSEQDPSSIGLASGQTFDVAAQSADEVIGLPGADVVRLVRLRGAEHSLDFWRQPAVVAELQTALEARLAAAGHRIQPVPQAVAVEKPAPRRASSSGGGGGGSGGFFRRKSTKGDAAAAAGAPLAEQPQAVPAGDGVLPGYVRVRVHVQEVCVRVCTDMGLYDSRSGPAVVVDVEIG